jgi:hypothetical protein
MRLPILNLVDVAQHRWFTASLRGNCAAANTDTRLIGITSTASRAAASFAYIQGRIQKYVCVAV